MAEVFKKYSDYYDQIYNAKDYAAESDFVSHLNTKWSNTTGKKLLDLGCGTGGHGLIFAEQGWSVTGIDRSEQMLEIARKKASEKGLAINFLEGDLNNLQVEGSYDLITAMFAVVSYITSSERLNALFSKVADVLKPGGLFIFDCWYAPAVLLQKPHEKIKITESSKGQIIRITHPQTNLTSNTVDVGFTLYEIENKTVVEHFSEMHTMRYFSIPEIEILATASGLQLTHACAFQKMDTPASENDWNVSIVLRK